MQVSNIDRSTIDHLNSLLRGELSAVETYRQALDKIDAPAYRGILEQCARSHAQRAQLLRDEVYRLGGEPAESSGPWGTFAKLVEGSAAAFGEKAAIAALEQGEDYGRDDYRRELDNLEPSVRRFIEMQVLPEQYRTHDAIKAVKEELRS